MEKSALVYIFLTIITVTLGIAVKNENYMRFSIRGIRKGGADRQQAKNAVAEFAIFCLLTGVSAFRIAVGNDYWVYRFNFDLIAQERHVSSEFGFNLIVRGIQGIFGRDNYGAIFAFFSILTMIFFCTALHDQAEDYALSLFLLLTGGYYFNSLNSVRYYFALAIALFAMKYVVRAEYGKFVLWIIAGAAFHKSILLVIPAYLVAVWLAKAALKRWHYIMGTAAVALAIVFGKSIIREVIFYFYPFYRDSYLDSGDISYVNIAKCIAVLALFLICRDKDIKKDTQVRFYFFLNVLGLLTYCCGSFIPEISRIGYYMIVSQIFLIPGLLKGIEPPVFRRVCYTGVILAFTGYFALLLKEMYRTDIRLLPYRNWIFHS